MFRSICLTLLLIGLSGCVTQQTRPASQSTLEQWVEQDLIPYLKTQLSQHPRFQGEPVLLGRLNDGAIQPKMDQLTRDIRDKINAELLATPGIHLARQQRDKHWSHRDRPTKPCDGEQPIHYFIGLDLRLDSSRQLNLTLRALDLQQNSWVSGFSRQWQGVASRQQAELLRTVHLDESLRGLECCLLFKASRILWPDNWLMTSTAVLNSCLFKTQNFIFSLMRVMKHRPVQPWHCSPTISPVSAMFSLKKNRQMPI
ncbi:MAG: hypothetical protein HPY30_01700 [Gammaproteobacteria bacterium (ex Lamellibrachia satsuma)]|nr:MAG: hypothetical protein HPY30_01700 [Gammaproteobacteria bacterium (ex Lamellibrachia satsuma)]